MRAKKWPMLKQTRRTYLLLRKKKKKERKNLVKERIFKVKKEGGERQNKEKGNDDNSLN